VASERKFSFLKQSDPVEFLAWFMNNLHMGLGGSKSNDSSIISRTFRGGIKLITRRIKRGVEVSAPIETHVRIFHPAFLQLSTMFSQVPFSLLTLDLPPAPLFKDEQEKNIIPQVRMPRSLLQEYTPAQRAINFFCVIQLDRSRLSRSSVNLTV
jgi:U4/U6.U5 tri-snRNP-associated protein 2